MNGNVLMGALIFVLLTVGFEAAYSGQDLVQQSFPSLFTVDFGQCSGDFFSTVGCWVANIGAVIADFFLFLFGIVVLLGQVISFNVPGAPVLLRVIVGTALVFCVSWGIASMIRGTRG